MSLDGDRPLYHLLQARKLMEQLKIAAGEACKHFDAGDTREWQIALQLFGEALKEVQPHFEKLNEIDKKLRGENNGSM